MKGLNNIPMSTILGIAGAGVSSLIKQKRELDHPSFGYSPKNSGVDYGKIAKTAVTYAKAYKEAKAEEAAKAAEQEQTTETYNEDDIIDVEWRVVD